MPGHITENDPADNNLNANTSPRNETALGGDGASVEQAILALRRGQSVTLETTPDRPSDIVTALETVPPATVNGEMRIVLGRHLAERFGWQPQRQGEPLGSVAVSLDAPTLCRLMDYLGGPAADPEGGSESESALQIDWGNSVAAQRQEEAAVALVKCAGLLPILAIRTGAREPDGPIQRVNAAAIDRYRSMAGLGLIRVAEARVPLTVCEDTRIVAFRPANGGSEHLAILLGSPDLTGSVLTRVHSACFTGDLLGSLRCDCGDQLRGALTAITAAGGGLLIYLAQEGRGIGLVNKLRAYQLQDTGLDTFEANRWLGFGADERDYQPAAEILRQLGVARIRLMTNNPDKIAQLVRQGIEVVDRLPLRFPASPHSHAYLQAKRDQGGHLF